MPDILNRTEIAKGVFLSSVTDSRYKVNHVTCSFFTQLRSPEKASELALVPRYLASCNAEYPLPKDFHNHEASLYAAKINQHVDGFGDTQTLELSVTSIDDAFALEGEKITAEAVKLLLSCLFNPLREGGDSFSQNRTEIIKQDQIDAIEAELNEKRIYARNRAYELLCEGEPCAINKTGTVGGTKKVTAKTLYACYKELLLTAPIEIICIGRNDFNGVRKILTDAFAGIERGEIVKYGSSFSTAKKETAHKTEVLQVAQSKMVLGFKTASASANIPALVMMSMIYGGTTTSKLFMNVREKLSLCYYCWARFNRDKGTMLVDCGVENANIEKAKDEILAQFEDVRNGNFTDDEINTAIMTLHNDSKTISDSASSLGGWYLAQIYRRDIKSPEASLSQYEGIGREEIIEAAKSVVLDAVYVLTGEEETNENNN